MRAIYQKTEGKQIVAKTPENKFIRVNCSEIQLEEIGRLSRLYSGNILNLLNVKNVETDVFEAEFIIYEPDYLIDISSLAECFRPYGNHFLNYSLSRLQPKEITAPILLGNSANFFIDAFINEDENQPVDYVGSLKKIFQMFAFEFTACEDLQNPKKESDFFANCQKHFNHIQTIVKELFPQAGIDKEKMVLEPSFISNALGLQGRLDVLSYDYSVFIELKSGKATEDFKSGGQFIHSTSNHYIQMILYLAILEFNMELDSEKINSYLLYSKYPVLSKERRSRKHLQKALSLRNQIVALEYALQKANDVACTQKLLSQINADELNTEKLSGNFFEQFLAPSINRFPKGFEQLKEHEKTYFLRLYTFVIKELWLSKVGEKDYEGIKKAAVLWNALFEDKLIAGELLYDLTITDNQAAAESHTITLQIPEYKDLYLPNFRMGDGVVLYERNSKNDTVNNHQVFKGSIESLEAHQLTIRLRFRQKNPFVWNDKSFYAIEHDYMDSTYTGMIRALFAFVNANQDRKDLLLCQRFPENKEAFLLIGPPGTGKTSIALKQMVESEIRENKSNILLLAYTNRAVDEICKTLTDISQSLPFIRIGSELNCDPQFRPYLLESYLDNCSRRKEVSEIISRCRIFVGTVASIWNKPELFQLKQFDLAIVDEATQLLEPHLLGVLCAKNNSGKNAIERFILIGDHKQLPAIVLQSQEESQINESVLLEMGLTNLKNSLFERLYTQYKTRNLTACFDILNKQGRMHPDIAAFPSDNFYEGNLGCVGLSHQTEKWDNKNRLNFYSIQASLQEKSTKSNMNEANKVVEICIELYQNGLKNNEIFNPQSIGIITPYRNQIALIRKQLQKTNIGDFSSILIDTVERFQGSQRDIIIYSFCVKTEEQLNALPNLLKENGKSIDRKLNVALTRARKQLFIVGNRELLEKNALYARLIEYICSLK
jgi:hypothetical protein